MKSHVLSKEKLCESDNSLGDSEKQIQERHMTLSCNNQRRNEINSEYLVRKNKCLDDDFKSIGNCKVSSKGSEKMRLEISGISHSQCDEFSCASPRNVRNVEISIDSNINLIEKSIIRNNLDKLEIVNEC